MWLQNDVIEGAATDYCVNILIVMGLKLPEAIPPIQGDRELLAQLIANLLENAMNHCAPGTRVVCAIARQDDAVILSVSDNGSGIPAGERENVLRRLYRLEKSRTTPGSGLGLSMVKAISDLHGATLTLEDNQPGLRVSVRFPVAAKARHDAAPGQ